jgi:3-oxoacyl-[acyl-carrier protein] reductase
MTTALVTGVSRRIGIAFTVARRLATDGMTVLATGWTPHDAEQPWGADDLDERGLTEALNDGLPAGAAPIGYRQDDLADPDVPGRLVDEAVQVLGGLDVLVATHARSSTQSLPETTVAELDLCWAVNVRASLQLVQRMAAHHAGDRGRVVLFTSGQHLGPMPAEVPYAVTKGALQQITASLAHALAPAITVNCINPGPVDTGYADDESRSWVASRMPMKRWGRPEDTAELVSWLVSEAGGWTTGQTLVSDGGWSVRG